LEITKTQLADCVVLEPKVFSDERGFFIEIFQDQKYSGFLNSNLKFVQDNYSHSTKGVLRGLHFQITKPQGKLIQVIQGEVFDVAVDLREGSPTYGQWHAEILSDINKKQFWVPPGFAHGFLTLSDSADFLYKCTDYYDAQDEGSIIWSDPTLDISWPVSEPILSAKDQAAPVLKEN
jgi:dTDP-4-dehydrorhamnose 3,5-epimerase